MAFILPIRLKQQMLEHALSSPEVEVCGLLAANRAGPTRLFPIPNIAEEPETTFYMQPQAQIAALKSMRKHGEQVCGIYHSHPTSAATPSQKDREQAAYHGTAYFIISLKSTQPVLGSFVFDGENFQDLAVTFE